jgi:hypothetical protein
MPGIGFRRRQKGIQKRQIMASRRQSGAGYVQRTKQFHVPADIAGIAKDIATRYKLDLTILEKKEMAALGMNGALSVSQGSCQPPKFIVLNYKGRTNTAIDLALVGKGVTFRFRRHLYQTLGRHGRHERGHVRRGFGHRGHVRHSAAKTGLECHRGSSSRRKTCPVAVPINPETLSRL